MKKLSSIKNLNCPGVTQNFWNFLKGVSYISFTFWIDSKCRWIDKKVFVGSDDPKWKIFLDGPILNCPGLTQNFGFFSKKILLQLFALLTLNMIRLLKKYGLVFINPLIYKCRFTGNSYFNCPGVTQKKWNMFERCFYITFTS